MADAQQVLPTNDNPSATADLSCFMVRSPVEDARGVDLTDLRERLRLSPAERVQRLVDEVRVWTEIRQAADAARKS
ncbi:MAG: hypothetical protein H6512_15490 [Acidimicrobiia bacterium]|nr:hypothetical protein [Acidimicrobiia bacterium]